MHINIFEQHVWPGLKTTFSDLNPEKEILEKNWRCTRKSGNSLYKKCQINNLTTSACRIGTTVSMQSSYSDMGDHSLLTGFR